MTSAAWPDEDGTRKAMGMLTSQASSAKAIVERPSTTPSIQSRMVSMM